jgi:hypothetical protein
MAYPDTAIGTLELNLPLTGQAALFQREKIETASIWFAKRFPDVVKNHGVPFVEVRETSRDGFSRVTPISINIDFFAGMLAGDPALNHSVVYFEPEMQFYYREPVQGIYKPTTAEKLQNFYRAMLMRCAQELPHENNKLNLCVEFRSDKNAKAVVQRAKSILAAGSDFFSATSPHQRVKGPELIERIARVFVEQLLTSEPGQVLRLHDAYTSFLRLLKEKNLPEIKRCDFQAVVGPLIREQFDVALRNDLGADEGQGVRGWKNVRLLQTVPG